ncbi:transposase-like protein [Azospirillum soli]|nr:transposase-like protein [Azospirillum soli]
MLDILVQSRRNTKATKRFFTKPLKGLHLVLCIVVTDKLRSWEAAFRKTGLTGRHRQALRKNNRPRSRISRFAGANEKCTASNRWGSPSASSPCMPPLTTPLISSAM